MRKLTFIVVPGQTKTAEQNFTHADRELVYTGSPERISGLYGLNLKVSSANGNTTGKPLTDTRQTLRMDITKHSCCWLEWTKTDKEYTVEVELHS